MFEAIKIKEKIWVRLKLADISRHIIEPLYMTTSNFTLETKQPFDLCKNLTFTTSV